MIDSYFVVSLCTCLIPSSSFLSQTTFCLACALKDTRARKTQRAWRMHIIDRPTIVGGLIGLKIKCSCLYSSWRVAVLHSRASGVAESRLGSGHGADTIIED